jgi:hypothetical protein
MDSLSTILLSINDSLETESELREVIVPSSPFVSLIPIEPRGLIVKERLPENQGECQAARQAGSYYHRYGQPDTRHAGREA